MLGVGEIGLLILLSLVIISGGCKLRESPDALLCRVHVILFVFDPIYDIGVTLDHILYGIRHGVQLNFTSKWIVKL